MYIYTICIRICDNFTFSSTSTFAQERGEGIRVSPNAAVSQNIGATLVEVTYGRPGLKGRS